VALLRTILTACALLFAFAPPAAPAQDLRLVEQDIKAGLLYNFLRYTDRNQPAPANQPLIVCVYGGDPFSGRLERMEGRTVNQRRIDVRAARTYAEVNDCALVFLSAEQRAQWPQLRSHLAGRSIMTVSDFDGFARSGGMFEFTRQNSRVGVRINVGAVQTAQLSVQERLLRLASVVRTEPP
jgi:hypothetical protein